MGTGNHGQLILSTDGMESGHDLNMLLHYSGHLVPHLKDDNN